MDQKRRGPILSLRWGTRIWRGFTLQLFLVAVLPLTVLVLLVTFGSLRLHYDAMRSVVADRNLRAVQSAASGLTQEISHRGETLELVNRIIGPNGQLGDILTRVQPDLTIFDGGVTVVSPAGLPMTFTGADAIRVLIASPAWSSVWDSIQSNPAGKAVYLPLQAIGDQLYLPVMVKNDSNIVLLGLFNPKVLLSNRLAIIFNKEPVTIMVVDANYQVLYQSGSLSSGENLRIHPGIQSGLAGKSGVAYYPTRQGEHVISSSTIQPVGWALMIEESWEDIASPLLQLTQYAPLIIIPILALALLALWFALRQIVEPMQALQAKAGDLARGNFESIRQPVGGVPEIGLLQGNLIDMAGQLKEAQDSLHSYIGAITDSIESERRNLARELHDDTIQTFIALGQYTQYALHWNKDPKVAQALEQVVNLTDRGTKNLRELVQGLRPIYIEDLGLATALEMQANNSDRMDGIDVHFQLNGEEKRLKPEVEMALYRMAQEALSNVRRHSGARNAWLSLTFRPESVILEVRDDGKGFDLPPDPIHYARLGHYGILSLHERADLIGAKLTISSAPGEGTLIRVRFSELGRNKTIS